MNATRMLLVGLLLLLATVFDDLQINATARLLLAKEHGPPLVQDTMLLTPYNSMSSSLSPRRGTMISPRPVPLPRKTRAKQHFPPKTCRQV